MDWLSKPGEEVFYKWLANIPSPIYHIAGFLVLVVVVFAATARFFAWCRDFLLNPKNRSVVKLSAGFTVTLVVISGVCCLAGSANPNDGGVSIKSQPGAGLIVVPSPGSSPGHTVHLMEEREDAENIFEDRTFEPPDP